MSGAADEWWSAAGSRAARRVLLVEDEREVRELVTRIVERGGYRVTAFPLPLEALAWVERRADPVDVLVTNVAMPQMTGFELAHAVRLRRPGTPVLFISGDVPCGRALGGESFLAKPFRAAALLGRIERLLGD